MSIPLDRVAAAMRDGPAPLRRDDPVKWRAAVAIVLREREGEVEVLLIRRAVRAGDPWSGHAALPGGRAEPDDRSIEHTARRELREEVGLDLEELGAAVLGQLSDHPRRGPRWATFAVTPVVVAIEGDPPFTLSRDEVAEARWVTLSRLRASQSRMVYWFRPWPRVPVALPMLLPRWRFDSLTVWGLTHGILSELFDRIDRR